MIICVYVLSVDIGIARDIDDYIDFNLSYRHRKLE